MVKILAYLFSLQGGYLLSMGEFKEENGARLIDEYTVQWSISFLQIDVCVSILMVEWIWTATLFILKMSACFGIFSVKK